MLPLIRGWSQAPAAVLGGEGVGLAVTAGEAVAVSSSCAGGAFDCGVPSVGATGAQAAATAVRTRNEQRRSQTPGTGGWGLGNGDDGQLDGRFLFWHGVARCAKAFDAPFDGFPDVRQ